MTSKRELKKDIRVLTETVIGDALRVGDAQIDAKDQKKVLKVIEEVVDMHNALVQRINHPDGKDNPKLVKDHYRKIAVDLQKGCNKAYDKLAKLVPDEKQVDKKE